MRLPQLVAALSLALSLSAVPVSAIEAPKSGETVGCNVTTLMPTAFFVQCGGVFAGTVVERAAGGHSGMLVCQMLGQVNCQNAVPISVDKDVGSLKGKNAMNCTFGDARDIVATFHCVV